jgi:hypothetical protein
LFNDVLLPAFKDICAHAKEVRKQMEDDSGDVLNNFDPDGDPDGEPLIHLEDAADGVQVTRIRCLSNGSLTLLEGIFSVLAFIFDPIHKYAEDYQMVLMKTMNRSNANAGKRRKKNTDIPEAPPKMWMHKLAFWCMNPAVIFRDMAKDTRSVILTSGTLSPVSYTLSIKVNCKTY